MGAELSPPAGLPMWLCESTMPGITVFPARSTVVAPPGIDTWPAAPTATIFPSRTTSVPFSIAAPVTGRMCALVNAWACPARAIDDAPRAMTAYAVSAMRRSGIRGDSNTRSWTYGPMHLWTRLEPAEGPDVAGLRGGEDRELLPIVRGDRPARREVLVGLEPPAAPRSAARTPATTPGCC